MIFQTPARVYVIVAGSHVARTSRTFPAHGAKFPAVANRAWRDSVNHLSVTVDGGEKKKDEPWLILGNGHEL